MFQPVEWHIKPLDDGFGENKMLLRSVNFNGGGGGGSNLPPHGRCGSATTGVGGASDSEDETEMYRTTEIGAKDNEELISLPKTTIRSRISQAMDLQLLKDPIFCSIAIGLALAYTASINFSMLFPYFLQVYDVNLK